MVAPRRVVLDIDTFVLDVFGTLIDLGSTLDIAAAIRDVLLAARRSDVDEFAWPNVYEPLDDVVKYSYYTGQESPMMFWKFYLAEFLSRLGQDYEAVFDCEMETLITDLILAEQSLYDGASLLDGAIEFIEWARSAGFRVLLCSNTSQSGWAAMQRLGLLRHFTGRDLAVSCAVGYQKVPAQGHISIYEWIITALKLDPKTTLVIEDEGRYVRIAADLGYFTARVKDGTDPFATIATSGGILALLAQLPNLKSA